MTIPSDPALSPHDYATPRSVHVGALALHPESLTATLRKAPLALTPYEFSLLLAFAERPRVVLSRHELAQLAPQRGGTSTGRTVDVHICHLREKLDDDPRSPQWILTIRGRGYMFAPHHGGK